MYHTVLVRYGEISLKGRNRHRFETTLLEAITFALREIPHGPITKTFGRIYVQTTEGNHSEIMARLQSVFGIVSLSPVLQRPLDLKAIKEGALAVIAGMEGKSFKVETRRPHKQFPIASPELSREIGAHVLEHVGGLHVDVHNPDIRINVEIRAEGAYLYSQVLPGLGGLPVGSATKGILLLSGGIDSPVAGFLSMKRGVPVEGLHFYSYPFTTERSKEKVVELARMLARYAVSGSFRLWITHFTEIQKALQQTPYPSLKITVMRRMMMRIAAKLAAREGAPALITGESLGQVASQTMESIAAINAVTTTPILRPLIAMDKQEIVDLARRIETFAISILPHEDCCTVFVPKNPATRPTLEQALAAEAHLDVEDLVDTALEQTELLTITDRIDWL